MHLKRRRSKCHSRIDESLGPQERKLLIRWPFFLHPQQTLEVQFSQSGVQRRKGLWEKYFLHFYLDIILHCYDLTKMILT